MSITSFPAGSFQGIRESLDRLHDRSGGDLRMCYGIVEKEVMAAAERFREQQDANEIDEDAANEQLRDDILHGW